MADQWGAFKARFTPITNERRKELRDALCGYIEGKEIPPQDKEYLIQSKYIDQKSGLVTRMGYEFIEREGRMDQYMAKYWPGMT